jgi:cell fate regulator YaaT (PSP1 superfamily)
MPIFPLPQFEADLKEQLDEEDRKVYEALKAPKTLVVRFGSMKMVGEFPYSGEISPGCGSKIVVRTHRGTELGEMLTSTCPNSGCGKSVSRKEMLGYIQNSGGRDYPFYQDGKVVRIATVEDMDRQSRLEQSRHGLKMEARAIAERIGSHVKIVDAEPILGDETLTFYYLSEERIDVRDIHQALSSHYKRRIELKQVGARDEARLTADYERCGQYCCCKNFLKVLKPVSMKSAKVQKATLDPLKISGRCGRLMCCLRYEDETYEELKKKLPRKKSRVGTPEGDGIVMDSQILTQLVLVLLDDVGPDGKDRQVAIAVEDLTPPKNEKAPVRAAPVEMPRGPRPPMQRPPAAPSGGGAAGGAGSSGASGGASGGGGAPSGAPTKPPENRGPRPAQPGGERPREDRPREERPREERPRDERREGGDRRGPSGGSGGAQGGGQGGRGGGGQPQPRPPQNRPPQQGRPAQGGGGQPGPQGPQSGQQPPQQGPRGGDTVDDIWNDMETDDGGGGGGGGGPGGGGPGGGDGRRRRRRRR